MWVGGPTWARPLLAVAPVCRRARGPLSQARGGVGGQDARCVSGAVAPALSLSLTCAPACASPLPELGEVGQAAALRVGLGRASPTRRGRQGEGRAWNRAQQCQRQAAPQQGPGASPAWLRKPSPVVFRESRSSKAQGSVHRGVGSCHL